MFQDVSFAKTRFADNVSFSRAEFAGETTFRQAALLREANFDKARFRSHASFTNGRFPHRANFREAVFGDILFLDAHVPGALDLRHASGPHIDLRPPTTVAARRAHDDTTTTTPRIYLQDARFDRMVVDWPSIAGGRLRWRTPYLSMTWRRCTRSCVITWSSRGSTVGPPMRRSNGSIADSTH